MALSDTMRRRAGLLGLVLLAASGLGACKSSGGPGVSVTGETKVAPTPQEDEVYLAAIRTMNESGQSQAALAFLDDYLKRHPGDPEALTLKGDALLKTGQLDQAEVVYVELDRRRIQPVAAFGLGQVRAKYGDWKGAVPQFARAAYAAPTDTRVLNNYGFALLKTEEYQKAYDVLVRATQLSPDNQQIRTNFVIAAMNSGRDSEVERALATLTADERSAVVSFARSWKP